MWKKADAAPEEISRDHPVIVLVSSSLPPDAAMPPWKAIAAYRSKHHGWRNSNDEKPLSPVWYVEIPAFPV
jgi:hypothetical protein